MRNEMGGYSLPKFIAGHPSLHPYPSIPLFLSFSKFPPRPCNRALPALNRLSQILLSGLGEAKRGQNEIGEGIPLPQLIATYCGHLFLHPYPLYHSIPLYHALPALYRLSRLPLSGCGEARGREGAGCMRNEMGGYSLPLVYSWSPIPAPLSVHSSIPLPFSKFPPRPRRPNRACPTYVGCPGYRYPVLERRRGGKMRQGRYSLPLSNSYVLWSPIPVSLPVHPSIPPLPSPI